MNEYEHNRGACKAPGTAGFTLLEMMVVVAIMTVVVGALAGLAMGLGDTARFQQAKTTANDEARKAMIYMARDIRQASQTTLSALPGSTLSYQIATDVDGNGSAVNVDVNLELTGVRTIERDLNDLNNDGVTANQLVLHDDETVFVLANHVVLDEDLNNNGLLDPGEDVNNNGVLDRGIWFEPVGQGVRVTVQTQGRSRRGHAIVTTLSETVLPRN